MAGFLLAAAILMAGTTAPPCTVECERDAAAGLLARGDSREAITALKSARARFPDDRELLLLLARAYLLEGNLFWAERVLRDGLDASPDDPELRTWLALVHLRQGDPELAGDDLSRAAVPQDGPLEARWRLLEAARAQLTGDRAAAADALAAIGREDTVFPEDRRAWAVFHTRNQSWWSESLTGTLDAAVGGTSNALAGSPTDPGRSGDASTLGLLELRTRFAPSRAAGLTPVVEVEVLGNGLGNDEYRELSSLDGSLRVGALWARDGSRVALGYRAQALYLDQDDSLFSDAHRLELEVEWASGAVAFLGGGHRSYRDQRRTRWEADLGCGGSLGTLAGRRVIAGATVRAADAESPAYDQLGLSAAVSTRLPVSRTTSLQIALSAVWDDYPNSGGAEGLRVFGTTEKRRDLLGRAQLMLWAPPLGRQLRPALELRYSDRGSTADETPGFDFSFTEWRAVVWLRWSFSADPWAPRRARPDRHVPLPWGLEDGTGLEEDRILDLLRRDEELRRGSSCQIK